MQRKRVPLNQVYDARALRVIVHDRNGAMCQDAVEACYDAQRVVHRLWRGISGEGDDYIANPSPSGYQSLHTAVLGESLIRFALSAMLSMSRWQSPLRLCEMMCLGTACVVICLV